MKFHKNNPLLISIKRDLDALDNVVADAKAKGIEIFRSALVQYDAGRFFFQIETSLDELLNSQIEAENYEGAAYIRDIISNKSKTND